ncbi:hypothetical protein [Bdellovibrio svalbardensis]|uniref:Uncharacterized protein n=1 Tax=Bdellovibrio svalbardensis TaxID=2972972 RepID=A0ABT6DEG7_9BACT|nr:hypothetical protein [Bdellovibrio svalbardensis]MDG0815234.1 hypothetical protein [Bdellovibrio svalbardensis]
MKKLLVSVIAVVLAVPLMASAQSSLEGLYRNEDNSKQVRLVQFNRSLTMNTVSYYSTGAAVNWFFEFILPAGRDVKVGETITGRVRSLDSYYNCVFDEKAFIQKDFQGNLKINHPLLTYHRETRSVRDNSGGGYQYGRRVDWNGWGWVETGYYFPIERWRVISSECVIDQRNWTTALLIPVNGAPPQPLPNSKK